MGQSSAGGVGPLRVSKKEAGFSVPVESIEETEWAWKLGFVQRVPHDIWVRGVICRLQVEGDRQQLVPMVEGLGGLVEQSVQCMRSGASPAKAILMFGPALRLLHVLCEAATEKCFQFLAHTGQERNGSMSRGACGVFSRFGNADDMRGAEGRWEMSEGEAGVEDASERVLQDGVEPSENQVWDPIRARSREQFAPFEFFSDFCRREFRNLVFEGREGCPPVLVPVRTARLERVGAGCGFLHEVFVSQGRRHFTGFRERAFGGLQVVDVVGSFLTRETLNPVPHVLVS